MNYRNDRYGNKISQLGFGCMRFSRKGAAIDYEKAEREILAAYEQGVNYFDTAYLYPGSEEFLGKALEKNGLRDKVNIATKLPQYLIKAGPQIEKTFREELKRLRTDHVDYYLIHLLTDISEWERLRSIGIEEWIKQRKEDGSIGQIGFSFHGETAAFLEILNAYDWDFCQIQYNYLDEHTQAGRKGLLAAADKGIPVIIMEPLRGGRLVNLPDKAKKACRESKNGFSPAQLGLLWLWDQPEVMCVLSGMNSEEMVLENCRTAADAGPGCITDEDRSLIEEIKKILQGSEKVGCTGCRYCMPCPAGVDIPGNFYYYNQLYHGNKIMTLADYTKTIGFSKNPGFASLCVKCGKCEQHCPQHIPIREKLVEADRHLRPLYYRAGLAVMRKFLYKKK